MFEEPNVTFPLTFNVPIELPGAIVPLFAVNVPIVPAPLKVPPLTVVGEVPDPLFTFSSPAVTLKPPVLLRVPVILRIPLPACVRAD